MTIPAEGVAGSSTTYSDTDGRAGERLIAGVMSGTSADGVDVALVAIAARGTGMTARLVHHHHVPYHPALRDAIFQMRDTGVAELHALARAGHDVSLATAHAVLEALRAAGLRPSDLTAVAAHGQTLYHQPPCTIQALDPSLVAAEVGAAVVSDFRRADCAAGGQGAPLVPYADWLLFRDAGNGSGGESGNLSGKARVLLNIGGIANLTYLPPDGNLNHLVAFDTGPGNCVSDHLVRAHDPGGPGYDVGGAIAARGTVFFPLLERALNDPFFTRPPPKSTDGPAMVELFRRAYQSIGQDVPFENLLRTACLLTATTIADAVRRFDPFPDELIVSGGGANNATIMELLRQPLGDLPVRTTDELGIPAAAKEAVAFALLGAATLDGEPGNVPSATGARRRVVLGSVTPRP